MQLSFESFLEKKRKVTTGLKEAERSRAEEFSFGFSEKAWVYGILAKVI